jgi:hypothetical protein
MKQVEKDIYRRGLEMTNGKIERSGEEDVRDLRESCKKKLSLLYACCPVCTLNFSAYFLSCYSLP